MPRQIGPARAAPWYDSDTKTKAKVLDRIHLVIFAHLSVRVPPSLSASLSLCWGVARKSQTH